MRGEQVIVRSYGGVPLVRRVWEEDEFGIYITNDEELPLLLGGKNARWPVGFPREDVFKYDTKMAASMDRLYKEGKWDWNKLEPI